MIIQMKMIKIILFYNIFHQLHQDEDGKLFNLFYHIFHYLYQDENDKLSKLSYNVFHPLR